LQGVPCGHGFFYASAQNPLTICQRYEITVFAASVLQSVCDFASSHAEKERFETFFCLDISKEGSELYPFFSWPCTK